MNRLSSCLHRVLQAAAVAAGILIVLGVGPAWAAVDLADGGSAFRWFSPTNIYAGQSVIFQGSAQNSGGTAAGAFYVAVYLSSDTIITTGDRYVGRVYYSSLAAGTYQTFSQSITVSAAIPPGTYYVGYIVDYNGLIAESDENNNTAYVLNRRLVVLNTVPSKPTLTSPSNGATGQSVTPILSASAFYDADGDSHAASQWLVDNNADWSSPAYESGETTAYKTSVAVPAGCLSANTLYYWTVRYKDSRGGWSAWASSFWFRTSSSGGAVTYGSFDTSQPIAGSAVNRWSFMTAWNLTTGALSVSPSWQNGSYTWNHPADNYQQWIARFAYDQVTGQTTALAWYYRQAHVQ
ncbi:MAG TPA: CARDB domain-containing protein [Kiritimatiellia bacterium]|nr:CARDB domain-containing protein [Kiritimatiellia bacterium]